MESVKKWLSERTVKKNGLYVHYSHPKILETASAAQLRQWARGGKALKLERAVLAGQGRRLLHAADALHLTPTLPALVSRCEELHAAVERGSLLDIQVALELLDGDYMRRKYVMCRDDAGVGLLHKAVFYDYVDIAEWLVAHYPQLVNQKDSEGRIALHYAAVCRDEASMAALLEGAGAARGARDAHGRTPAHYRQHRSSLHLPRQEMPDPARNPPGLVIKRHNIRIWCHDCDMARLQRVVWEGHGTRLLSEVSNQPAVKRFLEAVPYIMNTIREIHNSVIQNDLEGLMKHAGDPVPPQILSSRDVNNMTVLHKAAGLGHGAIVTWVTDRYPQGINDVDNDGRTPLHYAAAVRDDQHMYNMLVGLGADAAAVDNKNRTPAYYINRPNELDKNLLKTIPDAPRTPSSAYPPSWDWKILDAESAVEINKKSRRKKGSTENTSTKNTTNSFSEITNNRKVGMKGSSTHEYINNLPELEDNITNHNGNIDQGTEEGKETNLAEKENEVQEEAKQDDEVPDDADEPHKEEYLEHEDLVESTDETNVAEVENNEQEHLEEKHDDDENEKTLTEVIDTPQSEPGKIENDAAEEDNAHKDNYEENKDINEEINDKADSNEQEDHTDGPEIKEIENEAIKDPGDSVKISDDNKTLNNEEEIKGHTNEGNNNVEHSEDDDDVQVQRDTHSEYSDAHLRSTAEANHTGSVTGGNESNGRNTQESLYEGTVTADAEQDSQDASMAQINDREGVQGDIYVVESDIDPEVAELILTSNMEMLATLVLNGEGARLVGRRSTNLELQAFLDNVPMYMQKINKVHLAAREGNIRDLQSALDRRKFAIARDPISPNGATPLHIATIFGKTNIIKYLGGRFPETLSAVDFEGRSALHYAAVLPDNGHYFNLLQQLGANSKDLDDNGHSAEEYLKNPELLPYNQLLTDFGISEQMAQSMLSDKDTTNATSATNGHMDIPVFKTEEGRYLAKSLGDPLIKGLTEVANVKPKDPVAFLASFLQNFPEHEKPRLGTQESSTLVMKEAPEVENQGAAPTQMTQEEKARISRSASRTATRPHRPIDVITVDPQTETSPDAPEAASSSITRDEHGQSMLHFAAARAHTRNALFQLIQESNISIGYRDELYRTARDVSIQANITENTDEIDKWVLHLAARGNTQKIMELLLEGYDHILDVTDEEGLPITEVISQRGNTEMSNLLASIPAFEESRESFHGSVRRGDLAAVKAAVTAEGGHTLARAQNSFGRTSLHVAVLAQHEDIVAYLAQECPELLRMGDNLERTPLHLAMGVDKIESLSRLLIRAGSKRVLKDLKGRQPSYYFMNKSDILRLKEEEEVY